MANMDQSQPFAGIHVVEFGQYVSVPFCAQLLAEGGAEVIKVEQLTGDPTRMLRQISPLVTRTFLSRNRGKRSLPLALRDPSARPVIERLLAWADVVLMNFRPGLDRELGLDSSTLEERYPRLIAASVTAFGNKGPEATHVGMDTVVQARAGYMAANGRMVDGRPAPGEPVSVDYMCAMSLAFGVTSALLRRERTGLGGRVDTSLMQAAMTLANNQLIRSEEEDAPLHDEILQRLTTQRAANKSFAEQARTMASARALPMVRVYLRTYDTADAPIAIACGSRTLRTKFLSVVGVEDSHLDSPDSEAQSVYYENLSAKVESVMLTRAAADWIAALNDVGVPVAKVRFPIELFNDEQASANGMFHHLHHPDAGDFTVLSPPVRMNGEGFRSRSAPRKFATETREILRELSFADSEIDDLVDAKITHVEE